MAKRQISEVQMEHLKKAREAKKRLRVEKDLALEKSESQLASVNEQLAELQEQMRQFQLKNKVTQRQTLQRTVTIPAEELEDYSDEEETPPPKRAKKDQNFYNYGKSTAAKVVAGVLASSALVVGIYSVYRNGGLPFDLPDIVLPIIGGKPEQVPPWVSFQRDLLGANHDQKLAADKVRSPIRFSHH